MASTRAERHEERPRTGVMRLLTGVWNVIAGTAIRAQRDQVTGLASQFAYNAFIATVPLAIVVISAIALIGGDDAADRITDTYESQIPEAYQQILRDVLDSASSNQTRAALFLVFGALGALYLVGNAIGALITGLDRARGVPHRSWIRGKAVGIAFAAVWSLLMTLVNGALLAGQNLIEWLTDRYDLSGSTTRSLLDLLFPTSILLLLVMIWVLYRFGPNAPPRSTRSYMVGVLVASVGVLGFTQLFAAYLSLFDTFRVYGGLATIVVYLTFLWALGVALLVGAEGNEELRAVIRGAPTRQPRPRHSVDQD